MKKILIGVLVVLLAIILEGIYTLNTLPNSKSKIEIHPSWDTNQNRINDCEEEGNCDDSIDYSLPRENK